jgi:thermostable 8-oxoguanine DNA glycosylase
MLHHAVSEEGVAKMTTDSYLQHEEILRDITAKIEQLPVWKYSNIA